MADDIDRGPHIQIRDDSYPIQSMSIMLAGNEVQPEEAFRDLLIKEWYQTEATPRPLVAVNADRLQANVNKAPIVLITADDYRAEPVGHRHEFERVEVSLSIEITVHNSRQELWNVMAEIRRITYRWMLAFQPWHCIYFDGFRPDADLGPGKWSGVARVRLTAEPIPIFLRRVTGEEAPNTDPEAFPDGI